MNFRVFFAFALLYLSSETCIEGFTSSNNYDRRYGGVSKVYSRAMSSAVSTVPLSNHNWSRSFSLSASSAGDEQLVSDVENTDDTSWKDKLLKASNFASMLCVLDCTILPFVTVVLPMLGVVAGSPAQMDYLHELGHKVALFFVMPVGGTATVMNYFYSHKQKRIAAMGALGLLMVLVANLGTSCGAAACAHGHSHEVVASVSFLGRLMNFAQTGITHRITNISGCALLLGSNYLSRQVGCGCGHDHGSDHSHDHASDHSHDHHD